MSIISTTLHISDNVRGDLSMSNDLTKYNLKLLVWNCRGLGRNSTINYVNDMSRRHKLDIFLTKTMLSGEKIFSQAKKLNLDRHISECRHERTKWRNASSMEFIYHGYPDPGYLRTKNSRHN